MGEPSVVTARLVNRPNAPFGHFVAEEYSKTIPSGGPKSRLADSVAPTAPTKPRRQAVIMIYSDNDGSLSTLLLQLSLYNLPKSKTIEAD